MIAFYINEVSAVAVVSQKSFLYILIYLVSCRVLITKTDAKSNYANHTNGKKRSYKNKNNNNNIKLGEKDDRIFFYIMICDTRKERIKTSSSVNIFFTIVRWDAHVDNHSVGMPYGWAIHDLKNFQPG